MSSETFARLQIATNPSFAYGDVQSLSWRENRKSKIVKYTMKFAPYLANINADIC